MAIRSGTADGDVVGCFVDHLTFELQAESRRVKLPELPPASGVAGEAAGFEVKKHCLQFDGKVHQFEPILMEPVRCRHD